VRSRSSCLAPWAVFVAIALFVETSSQTAWAYRPFDGTDADVASDGTFELELGPVQYLHQPDAPALVTPALVLNQGIQKETELVFATNRLQSLGPPPPGQPGMQFQNTGFFTKHVWRSGTLQEATGPSIATEVGPLFPTGPGERNVGAEAATIVSVVTAPATFHFNLVPSLAVDRSFELFVSTIVEGPHEWVVRPVAEVFFDRDWGVGTTFSGLVGAIWRAREGLEFDAAGRAADSGGAAVFEARLGLTWAFSLWSRHESKIEGAGR
jgi:hypothetical protein